jgi:hypothetical protein
MISYFDTNQYDDKFVIGKWELWTEKAGYTVPHSDQILCIKGELEMDDIDEIQRVLEKYEGGEYYGEEDGVHRFLFAPYYEL